MLYSFISHEQVDCRLERGEDAIMSMSETSKQRVRLANAVLNSETMKDATLGGRSAGHDTKEEGFSDRQAAALEIEEVRKRRVGGGDPKTLMRQSEPTKKTT